MKHAFRAVARGLSRSVRSPKLVLGLWLLNLLAALPAALVMADMIEGSIGASLFDEKMAKGFDTDWWAEFSAEHDDALAQTFGPAVIGAGAVYGNLEAWWSGRLFSDGPVPLLALGVAFAVVWTFLLGGILDALSRSGAGSERPARGFSGFAAAAGRTFGRFLQLALAAGVLYFLIYRLARWLFRAIDRSSRDVTVEQTVFFKVVAVTALAVLLLHLVRIVFDFAKIAVFADDVSAPRALLRGLGFVVSRPGTVLAVYLGLGAIGLALVALYAWTAPGAGQSGVVTVALAFLFSQLYLAARLALRLALLSAELHLYRAPAA